jgi:hypothetical protein
MRVSKKRNIGCFQNEIAAGVRIGRARKSGFAPQATRGAGRRNMTSQTNGGTIRRSGLALRAQTALNASGVASGDGPRIEANEPAMKEKNGMAS